MRIGNVRKEGTEEEKKSLERRRVNVEKNYEKANKGLRKIRTKLNINIGNDNVEEMEFFPKLDKESFKDFDEDFLIEKTDEMRALIRNYIYDKRFDFWKETMINAYEKREEAEDFVESLEYFIKMEPEDTFDTMEISTAFLDKFEHSKNPYNYHKALGELEYYCSHIASGDEVLNLFSPLLKVKYDGVLEAMMNGLMKNPSVKDRRNVEVYFSTLIHSRKERQLKDVFGGGPSGLGE